MRGDALSSVPGADYNPANQLANKKETPMKQAQVKPGVRALLTLGHRGAVAVTVLSLRWHRPATWLVRDSSGNQYNATARQLRPLPPPTDPHGDAILASMRADALKLAPAQPGHTIDAGDVVIETTLHRLG